jgi:hypothetical protein
MGHRISTTAGRKRIDMDVKAFALNLASEEAIATRNLFSWIASTITKRIPSHILGRTSISLEEA